MKYFSSDKGKNSSSHKPSATVYTLYPKNISQNTLEKLKKFRWKTLEFWKDLAAPLTIIVVLFGQSLNWELTRQSQTLDRALADLKDQRAFRNNLIIAVTHIREVNAKHVLLCRLGEPASLTQQMIERDHARLQAIASFSAGKDLFNKESEKAFNELIELDESIEDVCNSEAAIDWSWRKRARKLFRPARKLPKNI